MPGNHHHPRIRTFHARHGRLSEGMRRVLHDVGPRCSPDWGRLPRPLVVEVGCGNGEAALAYAAAHPDHHVVALDVHRPGIAQLLRSIDEDGVPNVSAAVADALDVLDHRLPPASIAALHLFFPDPWPKARHHKRRFVRPDVLALLASRLEPGGSFLVATDAADYADGIQAAVDAHPAFDGGPGPRPAWRPVTTYERKALDLGHTIREFSYSRRSGRR